MAHYTIHLHIGNRGITSLDKTFRQTTTSRKKINEPYLPFITLCTCYSMCRTNDILPLAMWQGVVSDAASLLYSHYISSYVNSKQNYEHYTKNSAYRIECHDEKFVWKVLGRGWLMDGGAPLERRMAAARGGGFIENDLPDTQQRPVAGRHSADDVCQGGKVEHNHHEEHDLKRCFDALVAQKPLRNPGAGPAT